MFCLLLVDLGWTDIGSISYSWALVACLVKFMLTLEYILHSHPPLNEEDSNQGLCMCCTKYYRATASALQNHSVVN